LREFTKKTKMCGFYQWRRLDLPENLQGSILKADGERRAEPITGNGAEPPAASKIRADGRGSGGEAESF